MRKGKIFPFAVVIFLVTFSSLILSLRQNLLSKNHRDAFSVLREEFRFAFSSFLWSKVDFYGHFGKWEMQKDGDETHYYSVFANQDEVIHLEKMSVGMNRESASRVSLLANTMAISKGEVDQALNLLRSAILEFPDQEDIWRLYGEYAQIIFQAVKDKKRALSWFEKSFSLFERKNHGSLDKESAFNLRLYGLNAALSAFELGDENKAFAFFLQSGMEKGPENFNLLMQKKLLSSPWVSDTIQRRKMLLQAGAKSSESDDHDHGYDHDHSEITPEKKPESQSLDSHAHQDHDEDGGCEICKMENHLKGASRFTPQQIEALNRERTLYYMSLVPRVNQAFWIPISLNAGILYLSAGLVIFLFFLNRGRFLHFLAGVFLFVAIGKTPLFCAHSQSRQAQIFTENGRVALKNSDFSKARENFENALFFLAETEETEICFLKIWLSVFGVKEHESAIHSCLSLPYTPEKIQLLEPALHFYVKIPFEQRKKEFRFLLYDLFYNHHSQDALMKIPALYHGFSMLEKHRLSEEGNSVRAMNSLEQGFFWGGLIFLQSQQPSSQSSLDILIFGREKPIFGDWIEKFSEFREKKHLSLEQKNILVALHCADLFCKELASLRESFSTSKLTLRKDSVWKEHFFSLISSGEELLFLLEKNLYIKEAKEFLGNLEIKSMEVEKEIQSSLSFAGKKGIDTADLLAVQMRESCEKESLKLYKAIKDYEIDHGVWMSFDLLEEPTQSMDNFKKLQVEKYYDFISKRQIYRCFSDLKVVHPNFTVAGKTLSF